MTKEKRVSGQVATKNGPEYLRVTFTDVIESVEPISADANLPRLSAGLVETHTHGIHGLEVGASPNSMLSMASNLASYGVTRSIQSLVSSSMEVISQVLGAAEPLLGEQGFQGIHLEGPYIADERCGAHDPNELRDLSDSELKRILSYKSLRSITIAPERVSLSQVQQLSASGIRVAIGHSNASFETTNNYFKSGATLLTHAFNAMPQIASREPGPVVSALESKKWIELIADGHHVSPGLCAQLASWAPSALILVSDSMAAAGFNDGSYKLGQIQVFVNEGVARRADNGLLAGSTLTLNKAIENMIRFGVSPHIAFNAATTNPSNCYGLDNANISLGSAASLVTWDNSMAPIEVYRDGIKISS